ncbi:MAG: RluA family pseudouridine synthase [Lautropia sp.]
MPLPDAKPPTKIPTLPRPPDARSLAAAGGGQGAGAAAARPAAARAAATHLTVGDGADGQRLDNYLLGRMKGVPKSMVHRLIRTGQVRVNGKRRSSDARVVPGDDVRIPPVRGPEPGTGAGPAVRPLAAGEIVVVHEDDALIVIDKPAGLAVHGGSGIAAGLIERLRAARPHADFLELAHRLDRETSGLLLVAKRRSALLSLHRQMADGSVEKHYRAIVAGRWARQGATALRFPLRRLETATGDRRVTVDPGGQPSETIVRLVARADVAGAGLPPWISVLDCRLSTGRTHQIRVHLVHAGFPILGDQKYGDFALNRRLERLGHRRMFLHAFSLAFSHPVGGARLHFASPEPAGFEPLVAGLGAAGDTRAVRA